MTTLNSSTYKAAQPVDTSLFASLHNGYYETLTCKRALDHAPHASNLYYLGDSCAHELARPGGGLRHGVQHHEGNVLGFSSKRLLTLKPLGSLS